MSEYIWIIGGGLMQMPLADAIRYRGYKLIVSDRDANCAVHGDKFLRIDTYDMSGHLSQARKFVADGLPIVGVIADAIDVGHISAAVADYLGLPSLTYTVAHRLGNKAELTRMLRDKNPLRMIVERDIFIAEAWSNWFKACNINHAHCLPCVVKSVDNCGSRGVHIVEDLDTLGASIIDARKCNHDDTRVVIEEYIPGDEYSTDWFVSGNEVIQTNGARRYFDPDHPTIEIAYTNPWLAPDECIDLAKLLVERSGMKSGPLKIDFINNGNFHVIEATPRWSGSFDHTNSRVLSCGSNLLDELINWAVGLPVNEQHLRIPSEHLWSAVCAPLFKPGRITGFAGLDNAREVLGEYSYIIDRGLRLLPEPTSSAARPLYIIAQSNTEAGALAKAQRASNEVEPIYT